MPVRSARTPFVVWADELGALYAHAGSADTDNDANAGGQVRAWGIFDLNAFTPGPASAFYRETDRVAPYNLATATHWLREAGDRLGYAGPPRVEPWQFKADRGAAGDSAPAGGVEITFHDRWVAWQKIQWQWDSASKSYLRFQFGGPFMDAGTNEQVRAKNVIVMKAAAYEVDSSGHVLVDQIGTGEATVFLDGRAIAAKWVKPDRRARTRFYDASGAELSLNRGPTWIEVIAPTSRLLVTAQATDLPVLPAYEPPPR
jgi:hypothetical protein